MDQKAAPPETGFVLAIPRWEFIAMAAGLMALNALAVDVMLPGLQQIGASLGVENENHRQYVISAYILGFGGAQLFYGPISDRFGRRGPLLFGLVVYIAAAFAAAFAPSFGLLLGLRFIQGIGAAATRVIAVSFIRDVFGGRRMAEVMSLVFMVFMVIPVIAPAVGQMIMLFSEWHMIFIFMAVVAAAISVWTGLRMPETMHPEYRRPLTVGSIIGGFSVVLRTRVALFYTLATTAIFGALFGFINSAQQIYVGLYGLGVWFPVLFACVAGMMAVSSFLNSQLVGRFGMRRLSHGALVGFLLVNTIWLLLALNGPIPLVLFVVLFASAMVQFGWIGSNFNSIAMEPLGRVAGTASSTLGFMQTLGGGAIGATIGQLFDGTVLPLAIGFWSVSALGLIFVLIAEKGRLFQAHEKPIH
jgi:DHA1 family bicyclomycin/chloramphenicol resistance-like MFS transporter